ncbi:hypothetical protein [Acetobacter conturbans]|uniref:HTH araC/xylS-type domain-containing protein n=1 Tax=Acetobacter conturbans TaxID=1737472 RepID=A0ABX0K379_9PROT|nr:hypothetical protein [Acetobacter conturbans]NHN89599.1 hypothetical protein [Acetobacter conturbans]
MAERAAAHRFYVSILISFVSQGHSDTGMDGAEFFSCLVHKGFKTLFQKLAAGDLTRVLRTRMLTIRLAASLQC